MSFDRTAHIPEIVYVQTPDFDVASVDQISHFKDLLAAQNRDNYDCLMCLAYTSKTLYVYDGTLAHKMAYQQYKNPDLGIGPLTVRLWAQEKTGKHLLARRSKALGYKWSWPVVGTVDLEEDPKHALYTRSALDLGIDPKDLTQARYLGALHGLGGVGFLWHTQLPRDYGFRPDKSLIHEIAWIDDPEKIHPLSSNVYKHWQALRPYVT